MPLARRLQPDANLRWMTLLASTSPNNPMGEPDPELAAALANASRACQQAVIDYRSGLLDDAEMQRALVRSGLVITTDAVWLLDVDGHRWWRYQGGAPALARPQPDAGEP